MLLKCSHLQLQLFHVKGHQDKEPKHQLTISEQLNVDCDCQAKQYAQSTTKLSTAHGNLAILAVQPHLQIASKIICRNIIQNLCHATSNPQYHQYLKLKFKWTEQNANNVHWDVLNTSLNSFLPEDQWHVVFFINDKPPLCASPAHPHNGSPLCPLCQQEHKDAWHFLKCMIPARKALFQNLKSSLMQMTQKLQLHPCILTALWLGLVAIQNDIAYPDILNDIMQPLSHPIQHQTQLGWDQLYHGHLSVHWA